MDPARPVNRSIRLTVCVGPTLSYSQCALSRRREYNRGGLFIYVFPPRRSTGCLFSTQRSDRNLSVTKNVIKNTLFQIKKRNGAIGLPRITNFTR